MCWVLFAIACGKHESTSYGFTNNSNNKQGTQASTDIEILKTAIEKGQKELFLSTLEAISDVNVRLSGDRTPLIQSVISDKPVFVFILLQQGADTALVDDKQKTAMDHAIEKKNARILLMLDSSQSLKLQADLFAAALSGSTGKVKTALASGANPNVPNEQGETLLTLLIKNINLADKKNKSVMIAKDICKWVDKDFEVSTTDPNLSNALGETPLALAKVIEASAQDDTQKNKINELIDALLKAGATE